MAKVLTLLTIIFELLTVAGCSKSALSEKVITRQSGVKQLADPEEEYLRARSRWTVRIDPERRSGGSGMFSTLLSGSKGGVQGASFPLMVEATLMDEEVIEAGFRYYESMAGMDLEEAETFRKAYRTQNELDRYILVEALLQTQWAESYLDLKRWVVFIEDDQGHQYEPEKIVERSPAISHAETVTPVSDQRQQMSFDWSYHRKWAFLYFPKKDFQDNFILRADTERLKIVFLEEKEPTSRAGGCWIFQVGDDG